MSNNGRTVDELQNCVEDLLTERADLRLQLARERKVRDGFENWLEMRLQKSEERVLSTEADVVGLIGHDAILVAKVYDRVLGHFRHRRKQLQPATSADGQVK